MVCREHHCSHHEEREGNSNDPKQPEMARSPHRYGDQHIPPDMETRDRCELVGDFGVLQYPVAAAEFTQAIEEDIWVE